MENLLVTASTKKIVGYVYKFSQKTDKSSFSHFKIEKISDDPEPFDSYDHLLVLKSH